MTLSPFFLVTTNNLVLLYCSATRGEILALNNPVPRPMTIKATTKAPMALCFSITPGTAETMRIMCPIRAIRIAKLTVLYLPQ